MPPHSSWSRDLAVPTCQLKENTTWGGASRCMVKTHATLGGWGGSWQPLGAGEMATLGGGEVATFGDWGGGNPWGLGRWLIDHVLALPTWDLSPISKNTLKKSECGDERLQSQHGGVRDRWIPGFPWPASLSYLASRKSARDPVSKKKDSAKGTTPKVVIWPPYMC